MICFRGELRWGGWGNGEIGVCFGSGTKGDSMALEYCMCRKSRLGGGSVDEGCSKVHLGDGVIVSV